MQREYIMKIDFIIFMTLIRPQNRPKIAPCSTGHHTHTHTGGLDPPLQYF